MKREQVIQLAREAGFLTGSMNQADGSFGYHLVVSAGKGCIVEMERFAALVAAAEREACAKVCEGVAFKHQQEDGSYPAGKKAGAFECAAAIRDRAKEAA